MLNRLVSYIEGIHLEYMNEVHDMNYGFAQPKQLMHIN